MQGANKTPYKNTASVSSETGEGLQTERDIHPTSQDKHTVSSGIGAESQWTPVHFKQWEEETFMILHKGFNAEWYS